MHVEQELIQLVEQQQRVLHVHLVVVLVIRQTVNVHHVKVDIDLLQVQEHVRNVQQVHLQLEVP